MQLVLKNSSGFVEEIPLKNQTIRISSFFNYLELTVNEETVNEIRINDNHFPREKNKNGLYIIPCYMGRENQTTIQLTIDSKLFRFVVRYEEELFIGDRLIDSFADFHRNVKDWMGEDRQTIAGLVEAIKSGDINLLQIINPLTGLDDESILDDIYNVLPFALDICTKPRQHLRVEEEVLDVELVKRITPASIQHLASHSEHWHSRTVTGLIPSRLLAEVYEDDVNIYENIFFKMVIQAIYNYVAKKHEVVNIAISQKDTLHDWEFYAGEINDYKKIEMLQSLLPEYDRESEEGIRKQFKQLQDKLLTIEKQLSSIISTPFFQSLDPVKRLELPIHPTNIINMDNRYNELFKIWNNLMTIDKNNKEQELSGGSIFNVEEYYKAYVQVLSIYSIHLLGYEFHDGSYLELQEDQSIAFDFSFSNDYCLIHANNVNYGMNDSIHFEIEESLSYLIPIPKDFPISFQAYEDELVFKEIWKDSQQLLVFRTKPNASLEKKLGQVIKRFTDDQKGLTKEQIIKYDKMDVEWRQTLSDALAKIPKNRTSGLNLHTLFHSLGSSENDLLKYTNHILEAEGSSSNQSDIYMLPINLEDFKKVKDPNLLRRLINYGESFSESDAHKYGDYQKGIIPISQTDLRSIQRLSKLFHLFIYRQLIHWGTAFTHCPSCESNQIMQVDQHSWQCRELDCQLIWGVTKCSGGCNEYYEWMKPNLTLKLNRQMNVNSESIHLDKLLLNEMLFDRMVITAFDYQIEKDQSFIYHPRCPKCGKSSINT